MRERLLRRERERSLSGRHQRHAMRRRRQPLQQLRLAIVHVAELSGLQQHELRERVLQRQRMRHRSHRDAVWNRRERVRPV